MRQFVLTEYELRELLMGYLQWRMVEYDGVDNWEWYGASKNEVIHNFHPDHPTEDEIYDNDIHFKETVQAMLDAGAYRELAQIDFD